MKWLVAGKLKFIYCSFHSRQRYKSMTSFLDFIQKPRYFNTNSRIWWVGFGSCHSLGVAVGLRGYGMCQRRWRFVGRHFLTNAKGRPFHFSFVQRYLFFKSPRCPKAVTCPRGKSLIVEGHPLDDQIVRALLLPTVVCLCWLGLSKLRPVPHGQTKLRKQNFKTTHNPSMQ